MWKRRTDQTYKNSVFYHSFCFTCKLPVCTSFTYIICGYRGMSHLSQSTDLYSAFIYGLGLVQITTIYLSQTNLSENLAHLDWSSSSSSSRDVSSSHHELSQTAAVFQHLWKNRKRLQLEHLEMSLRQEKSSTQWEHSGTQRQDMEGERQQTHTYT